jgi:hypothetical protein
MAAAAKLRAIWQGPRMPFATCGGKSAENVNPCFCIIHVQHNLVSLMLYNKVAAFIFTW